MVTIQNQVEAADWLRRGTAPHHALVFGLLLFSCVCSVFSQKSSEPIKDVIELRSVTTSGSSMGRQVEVSGVVVGRVRSRQLLFVQGDGGAVSAYVQGTNVMIELGRRVRLRGVTGGSEGIHVVANEVEVLGDKREVLDPPDKRIREIEGYPDPIHWVGLQGTVKSIRRDRSRVLGVLRQAGRTIPFVLPSFSQTNVSWLKFAKISLQGVVANAADLGVGTEGRVLWVGNRADLKTQQLYAEDPFARRQHTISVLRGIRPTELWAYRPRVRGELMAIDEDGRDFVVRDETGQIRVHPLRDAPVRVGDLVDVVGFTEYDGGEIYLGSAEVRILGAPASLPGDTNTAPALVHTTVRSLRRLQPVQLIDHPPVRLSGVITFHAPNQGPTFLQDDTGGVEIVPPEGSAALFVGAGVMLHGYAEPSGLSPRIVVEGLRIATTNSLPIPEPGHAGAMLVGQSDGSYIFAEGIIRSAEPRGMDMEMRLNRYGPIFPVLLHKGAGLDPADFIDARVRVEGVSQARFNRQGQVIGSRILVPAKERIHIQSEPPAEPFEIGIRKIADLKTFRIVDAHQHRNRMEGVVTLSWPGKIYVQDETGSLEVKIQGSPKARVGDLVTVLGFPVLGSARPMIEDATVKIIGRAEVPGAIYTHAERVLTAEMNGRRAVLDGILLSKTQGVREFVLMLRDGDITVPVVLRRRVGPMDLEAFEIGSQIQVTGICELNESEDRNTRDVRLLVDSVRHLQLIASPPWWTLPRLFGAIGGMACILIASFWWVAFLQRRVTQTQNRFTTAFKASPIPVAILTQDGHVVLDANDSFTQQFSYKRRDIVSRRFEDVGIALDGQFMTRVDQMLQNESSLRGMEFRLRTADGKERFVLLSVELIDVDGEEALLMLFQDITERFNLMNQLRESQKMEAVGQLAAGVAHDFNNLLTVLRGNCDLLADVAGDDSELVEIQSEMDAATTRASDLTRQLLAFSRKQIMQPRIVDLNDVVNSAMKMLKRLLGEDVQVTADLYPDEQTIFADAGMIDQILVNLAVNARDAMPQGGSVTFTTKFVELTEANLPDHPEGQIGPHVTLTVADDGEGMDAETQKHIFEPFFTTKELGKGTGLGLATVFGIVKQHRGWIEVESSPGQGTAFTAWFPLATDREETETVVVTKAEILDGTETILVVEDEDPLRRMIARTLEKFGYTVHVAENGLAGREVWLEQGAGIDLLVTDIMMPGGLNGLEMAQEFLKDRPGLRVLYISGYSPDLVRAEHELDVGVNFLPKPFTNKALLETVRRCLARDISEA